MPGLINNPSDIPEIEDSIASSESIGLSNPDDLVYGGDPIEEAEQYPAQETHIINGVHLPGLTTNQVFQYGHRDGYGRGYQDALLNGNQESKRRVSDSDSFSSMYTQVLVDGPSARRHSLSSSSSHNHSFNPKLNTNGIEHTEEQESENAQPVQETQVTDMVLDPVQSTLAQQETQAAQEALVGNMNNMTLDARTQGPN